jgi:hypothetical protein
MKKLVLISIISTLLISISAFGTEIEVDTVYHKKLNKGENEIALADNTNPIEHFLHCGEWKIGILCYNVIDNKIVEVKYAIQKSNKKGFVIKVEKACEIKYACIIWNACPYYGLSHDMFYGDNEHEMCEFFGIEYCRLNGNKIVF